MKKASSVLIFGIMGCFLAGCATVAKKPAATFMYNPVAQIGVETCPALPAVEGGRCAVATGTTTALLLRGTVLTPYDVITGGSVLIDENGAISCVGCDCPQTGATVVTCPTGVIGPGFINAHDHLNYDQACPGSWDPERYDQRQDWRMGLRGHTKIPYKSNSDPLVVAWSELRQVMSGTTSIAGSGGVKGFLRNLDASDKTLQEGMNPVKVYNNVFPLGDSNGTQLETTCNYPKIDPPSVLDNDCYLPHVSEGVDQVAHNEFLCLSGQQGGGQTLVSPKSAFIHLIALQVGDGKIVRNTFTSPIWAPRSNIALYGNTEPITMYDALGIWNIGLSTDWTPSGSMNMLRELTCADEFNKFHLNGYFTDYQLWRMATFNASVALKVSDQIGFLVTGYLGDVAIFDGTGAPNAYRAVIEAGMDDVILVLRGGKPLYGDMAIMAGLPRARTGCEPLPGTVCNVQKAACIQSEVGKMYLDLANANKNSYPLFYCTTPQGEPTCTPMRPKDKWGCGNYPLPAPANDFDGDGVIDTLDNCPKIFNPVRPLDGYYARDPYACKQADSDNDGTGDACDPKPYQADGIEIR